MTERTNIYFDFEFIDDGREIVPISLGMCTGVQKRVLSDEANFYVNVEDLYLEYQFDPARADDWVRKHVFPHLKDDPRMARRGRWDAACQIVEWVQEVCGDAQPQFWGHGPAYDFVCLVQHFGTKEQLPKGWPIRPRCLEQLADHLGIAQEAFPKQPEDAHNALADAKWNRSLHEYLKSRDD